MSGFWSFFTVHHKLSQIVQNHPVELAAGPDAIKKFIPSLEIPYLGV